MFRLNAIRAFKRFLIPTEKFYATSAGITEIDQELPIIEKLSAEYEDVACVVGVLKRKPKINQLHFSEWKTRIDLLKSFNFTDAECFKMISKYPSLLKIPPQNLDNVLRYWYGCHFGLKNSTSLLFLQPVLLNVDIESINTRIPYLRTLFRKSEALALLLTDCPNIMFENWESVLDKLEYLTKVRGFTMGDVLHSKALTFTLDFIKFRLTVLEKCGIYKELHLKPHQKNKYDKSQQLNPHLNDILTPDDKIFANEVADITLEEYNACEELFATYGEDDTKVDDYDYDDEEYDDEDEEDDEDDEYERADNYKENHSNSGSTKRQK